MIETRLLLITGLLGVSALSIGLSLPSAADEPKAAQTSVNRVPKDPPALTRLNSYSIALEGSITPEIATKFATMVDAGTHALLIYSSGGDAASSLAIGRVVHSHHMDVQVVGVCAAACAKYGFLAGAHRSLTAGSLLLFSDSASSIDLIASSYPGVAVHRAYLPDIVADQNFYEEIGIPERALYDPSEMMHPLCYAALRPILQQADLVVVSQYSAVVIPKNYFDEIGVRVEGSWPSTPDDLAQRASHLIKAGKLVGLIWEANVRPLEAVQQDLRKVTACTTEQQIKYKVPLPTKWL